MVNFQDSALDYAKNFTERSNGFPFPRIEFLDSWNFPIHEGEAVVTASLPVCNQEALIEGILVDFFKNVSVPAKLIIILDACVDKSEIRVREFLNSAHKLKSSVNQVVLFRTSTDIFESSCDNFSLKLAETPYFMTIQADNFLDDPTFLPRAINAISCIPELTAVSTRGVVPLDHPRRIPHRSSTIRKLLNLPARVNPKMFKSTFLGPFSSSLAFYGDVSTPPASKLRYSKRAAQCVFLGEAVVRGPIIWTTAHLKLINGFNDVSYFLGWDDYDASYRLYCEFKFRVGYLPSSCYSLVNTGTNSFPRSISTLEQYSLREDLATRSQGLISEYWKLRDAGRIDLGIKWKKRRFQC